MQLEYLGHSSFRLLSDGGTTIVTDPYRDVGFDFPRTVADAVTVSHSHFDHSFFEGVEAPVRLNRAGSFTVKDVRITATESFHDDAHGRKRGENFIFRFEADGVSVCHLGDLGEPFGEGSLKKIPRSDVLLIPVGGNYTIDAAEAEKYVRALLPKVAIPMHYKVKGLRIDIAGPEPFLGRFEHAERAGSVLRLDRETLNGHRIIIMERA